MADVSTAGTERGVKLKVSAKEVEEGDRLTLTATIKSPGQATRVTLERLDVPLYIGDPEWESVKSVKVKGRHKVTFRQVATALNNERYRAVVAYRDAQPMKSKSVNVTVWRWIPLGEYEAYYEAGSGYFATVSINGQAYAGYYAYSATDSWEERFTPGRHCDAFRSVIGLQDKSDDGSTGTVSFTADDTVVYTSPALTPGMQLDLVRPLSNPYRFGFQLYDTSAGDLDGWPALGEPALRCTGVG